MRAKRARDRGGAGCGNEGVDREREDIDSDSDCDSDCDPDTDPDADADTDVGKKLPGNHDNHRAAAGRALFSLLLNLRFKSTWQCAPRPEGPTVHCHSRPGMVLLMNLLQPFFLHVGVDLGGGDTGVAEEFLHAAQVGPAGEQMGRKGVAQGVG